jgi:hypothetical protein
MLGARFFLSDKRWGAKTGLNWSWIDGLYNTCTIDCLFVYAMAPGNAPPDGSWSMGSLRYVRVLPEPPHSWPCRSKLITFESLHNY